MSDAPDEKPVLLLGLLGGGVVLYFMVLCCQHIPGVENGVADMLS